MDEKKTVPQEEDQVQRHASLLDLARSLVSDHKLGAFWPDAKLLQKGAGEFTKVELDQAQSELDELIKALG